MASSPYINHFIQPDSIIPNPADPQSWNRYSYVQNNPIRYSDPTGHVVEETGDLADYYCNDPKYCKDGDAKFDPYILRNKKNNNIPDQSIDNEISPFPTSPNHCQNGLLNCAITLPNDLPIIEFNLWVLQFKGSGSASLVYLADPHSPFYISNGSWGTDTWDFSYSGFSFGAESLSVNFYDTVDISFLFGASVDLNPTPNVSMYFQGDATLESNNFLAEESIKAEFSVRPIEAAFLYYLRRVPVKFPGIERFPLVQP